MIVFLLHIMPTMNKGSQKLIHKKYDTMTITPTKKKNETKHSYYLYIL